MKIKVYGGPLDGETINIPRNQQIFSCCGSEEELLIHSWIQTDENELSYLGSMRVGTPVDLNSESCPEDSWKSLE